jgi:hypothetical protein
MGVEHGVPLAPAGAPDGRPRGGVACGPPTTTFHIHVHLAVYVGGVPRPVPAGIGLVGIRERDTPSGPFYDAGGCYYALHTHAQDGVVHVEGAAPRTYTLGQVFAVWGQPLTRHRVGPARGPVTAYVDGQVVSGSAAAVPLRDRSVIQLDVGSRTPPAPVSWLHF